MTLMTETVAPVAKPVPRPRTRKPATVSASALAVHIDCSRQYIGKLEAEGVIQRRGNGFPLDQSRVAYLRYLRRGGPVNIVPNWHDMNGHAVPFSRSWKG
jgi:hypothetical protein